MELVYIDNKKTLCWSKPDAVFAQPPAEGVGGGGDGVSVVVPHLKDLPKMFNFPRETEVVKSTARRKDTKNVKNILAVKRQNHERVAGSSSALKSELISESRAAALDKKSEPVKPVVHRLNNDTHAAAPTPTPTQTDSPTSASLIYSGISSHATLKDLCAEDKQRIANLIQELAKMTADKEKSRSALEDERKLFETQIKKLLRRHDSVLTEKQKLQDQYLECFKIVLKYQENLARAAKKDSTAVAEGDSVAGVEDEAQKSAGTSQRVDRDAQTDDSRDEDGDNNAKNASLSSSKQGVKDVSTCETQTSPALSLHANSTKDAPSSENAGFAPQPPPHPTTTSHLYPRSRSPPFRQHYDQPPQSLMRQANDSRIFSNFNNRPPVFPVHQQAPTGMSSEYGIHPSYYNAIPLQVHHPDYSQLPHSSAWHFPPDVRVSDSRGYLDPSSHSAPYFVPVQLPSRQSNRVPHQDPPRVPSQTSHLPNPVSHENPPAAHTQQQHFATPPLHQETQEDPSTTHPKVSVDHFRPLTTDPSITLRVESRTDSPHEKKETSKAQSAKNDAGSSKPAPSDSSSSSSSLMRRKVSSSASKSKPKPPSPDEDDDARASSSGSSTRSASAVEEEAPDSSTIDSVSTLCHLPTFHEGDSKEKLMEIREALKREQDKLATKLTKQEKYIRKKEQELRRLAGKGRKKRDEKEEEDLENDLRLEKLKDVGNDDLEDDADLATSLNSARSKNHHQTNRNTLAVKGKLPSDSYRKGISRTKHQLIDIVESLESTDGGESDCASWSQPLKSSTMIGEAAGGHRSEVCVRGRGRAGESGKTRSKPGKTRTKTRSEELEPRFSSDQENELLDDIFFLH